jgi:Domain of unknown function DUF11
VTIYSFTRYHFQFQATVVNNGPDGASHAVLTATVSPAEAFQQLTVSADIPCAVSGNTITGTQSSLLPAGTTPVSIGFWRCAFQGISYGVAATVSSATPDPHPANNRASGSVSFLCFNVDTCYLK